MKKLRLLQFLSIVLWIALVNALYVGFRDRVYLPVAVGICMNLLFQYGVRGAIRRERQRLSNPSDMGDSRATLKHLGRVPYMIGMLVAVVLIDMFLEVQGTISQRTFASIGILCALLAFIALTLEFSRLKRTQKVAR